METIKSEAKRNSKLPADLDNFRSRYYDCKYDERGNPEIEVFFPSAEIYSFELNFFKLLSNSRKVKFQPRWFQRPDYVSFDFYGSVIYWPIILYVNRINSIEDFSELEEILVPEFTIILEIAKDKVSKNSIVNLETDVNIKGSKIFKLYPLDKREQEQQAADDALNPPDDQGDDDQVCPPCPDYDDEWIIDGGIY